MTAPYENAGRTLAVKHPASRQTGEKPIGSTASRAARELYRQYFDTVIVSHNDAELRNEAFRLRFQVYCVENSYEDPAANADGLERDDYDERAVHCLLLHKGSRSWAGAVRLILPSVDNPDHSFALQAVCNDPQISDSDRFPIKVMAEVSRFCISKDFRKRQGDWLYPESNEAENHQDERRIIPNMTLGLIEGLIKMSLDHGIFYWCAVMERPLLRLLSRLGIHFETVGPLVDYHGRRQPCMIELRKMLIRVQEERPDVWEILTDGGRHWNQLECLWAAASDRQ